MQTNNLIDHDTTSKLNQKLQAMINSASNTTISAQRMYTEAPPKQQRMYTETPSQKI